MILLDVLTLCHRHYTHNTDMIIYRPPRVRIRWSGTQNILSEAPTSRISFVPVYPSTPLKRMIFELELRLFREDESLLIRKPKIIRKVSRQIFPPDSARVREKSEVGRKRRYGEEPLEIDGIWIYLHIYRTERMLESCSVWPYDECGMSQRDYSFFFYQVEYLSAPERLPVSSSRLAGRHLIGVAG